MVKTPLKKVNSSYKTVMFMWFLMFLIYTAITLMIFPRKFSIYLTLLSLQCILQICHHLPILNFLFHLHDTLSATIQIARILAQTSQSKLHVNAKGIRSRDAVSRL